MDFGDGPDAFDPEDMKDEETQIKMVQQQVKKQMERSLANKSYVDKVFGMVHEAVDCGVL